MNVEMLSMSTTLVEWEKRRMSSKDGTTSSARMNRILVNGGNISLKVPWLLLQETIFFKCHEIFNIGPLYPS